MFEPAPLWPPELEPLSEDAPPRLPEVWPPLEDDGPGNEALGIDAPPDPELPPEDGEGSPELGRELPDPPLDPDEPELPELEDEDEGELGAPDGIDDED